MRKASPWRRRHGQVILPGSTQRTQALAPSALANFINPAGLEPRGQNLFAESAASGAPNRATPANGWAP
jgi:flagellar basal-body rod protein FlgG